MPPRFFSRIFFVKKTRRSKVRFAPTFFISVRQKTSPARFLAPSLKLNPALASAYFLVQTDCWQHGSYCDTTKPGKSVMAFARFSLFSKPCQLIFLATDLAANRHPASLLQPCEERYGRYPELAGQAGQFRMDVTMPQQSSPYSA